MVEQRTPARIGTLQFKYQDPSVDVDAEARTVEHETIDDSIVVQTLGRRPDGITINATVADYELDVVDDLTKKGIISLRTERWSGSVIVESTTTSFMRAIDADGAWLHEATINCLEVSESAGGGGSNFGSSGSEALSFSN